MINENYFEKDTKLFKIFRYYLSHNLSIIFIIIIKLRTMPGRHSSVNNLKTNYKKRKSSVWINPLNIEQKKLKKGKKIKSIYFLILLLVISIISNIFNQILKKKFTDSKSNLCILCEIINFIALSILILNKNIYKHQILSLGVISFTLLSMVIYLTITKLKIKILYAFGYYFIYSFLYGLYDVLGKKYLNLYFDSPYNIMLKIGLIISIILIIYDITLYYYFEDYKGQFSGIIYAFSKNLEELGKSFILFFSISIFFEFLFNVGIWLTIYYFNPCYFIISELISECILFISDIIAKKKRYNTIEIII